LREWNFTRLAELTGRTPIRAGAPRVLELERRSTWI
jgi:hypothetical protein